LIEYVQGRNVAVTSVFPERPLTIQVALISVPPVASHAPVQPATEFPDDAVKVIEDPKFKTAKPVLTAG
jgi:hypothetical protein